MSIKLSDMFSSVDEVLNNAKLEEVFNKTKDVAETVGRKSAERLEISRKKVECLDAKAKLSKAYEKFGKLQYNAVIGEEFDSEAAEEYIRSIGMLKEKIETLTAEIEIAKAEFNESVSNAAKWVKKDDANKTESDFVPEEE